MNMSLSVASLIFITVFFTAKAAQPLDRNPSKDNCNVYSVCRIYNGSVTGTVMLSQERVTAPVRVSGRLQGLSAGLHGFHVHQYGDLSNGCTSAGPHYNPFSMEHGAPNDRNRHVGDLGNIEAGADGVASFDFTDNQLRLCGPLSIMGRAIVVHEREDDLGRGGNEESKKTGNAGPRLGCCVIGVAPNENQ